jgi:hypothetical protein
MELFGENLGKRLDEKFNDNFYLVAKYCEDIAIKLLWIITPIIILEILGFLSLFQPMAFAIGAVISIILYFTGKTADALLENEYDKALQDSITLYEQNKQNSKLSKKSKLG